MTDLIAAVSRRVLEAAGVAVIVAETSGDPRVPRIVTAGANVRSVTGLDACPGAELAALIPGTSAECAAMREALLARREWAGMVRWPHEADDGCWFEAQVFPCDEGGAERIILTLRDVCEAVATRKALEASEARLRAIVENEPACVKLMDRDGRLVEMNRAGLQMLEAESVEALVAANEPFVVPLYRDAFERMCANVFAGRADGLIFEVQGLRGTRRWVQSFAVPIWRDPGRTEVEFMLSVTHDITRSMEDQRALRELNANLEARVAARTEELTRVNRALEEEVRIRALNAEQFRRAQRMGGIGTWDADVKTGRARWSDGVAPLLGYREGHVEPSYAAFMSAVHPDDRERVERTMQESLRMRSAHEIEHRVIWPDGSVRWLQERGDVVRDGTGEAVGLAGAVMDITARKRDEERAARLLSILEATPDPIFTVTPDGRLEHLNRAALRLATAGEAGLSPVAFGDLPTPPDWRIADSVRAVAERDGMWTGETTLMTATGECIPVQQTVIAHRDSRGQITHFSAVNRDLHAQKRHEAELVRLKERAEAASRAKSEFLSRMSHDLRTPLNAMLGFAQILEMDGAALSQESRTLVQRIQTAGWHLLDLIDDVLDLSGIEAGSLDMKLAPVELHRMVEEAAALVEPSARARQVRVSIETPRDGMWVHADQTRLREILLNLLSNAVNYNRAGGRVVVSASAYSGQVRVAVRDTGRGLSADQVAHLFEPFNRLGADELGIKGTGMGLVISKRLAEAMGGTIDVESTPREGSTFTLSLDRAEPPIEVRELRSPAAFGTRDGEAVRGRVLYVEDDSENTDLVRMILALRPGVELLTAHDGTLGVELALACRPDLVILDLQLPGQDGYAVCRRLRATELLAGVPVIALSASAMPEDIELATATGFDDYLTKPVEVGAFLGAVDAALGLVSVR